MNGSRSLFQKMCGSAGTKAAWGRNYFGVRWVQARVGGLGWNREWVCFPRRVHHPCAVILSASELRFSFGAGLSQMVRLAGDAGFDGIAIGTGCGRGDVAPLVAATISAGMVIPVVAAPLGDGPLGPGRRLPYLSSMDDGDERRAARSLFDSTVQTAAPLGVGLFTVTLGEVPLGVTFAEVARGFARRELDEGEPAAPVWAAAIGERRARSEMFLDACRASLDRILPAAERRNIVLAIEMAGDPWGGPSPREAATLLEEYRNGPIAVVWDEARMQVLAALGVGPSDDRRTALAAAARLWRANEAVGMEVGYLPGLGDPDRAPSRPVAPLVPSVATVITGRPDSTTTEVARARDFVATPSAAGQ
jgi:Xylose isomerase-like TIM barrel